MSFCVFMLTQVGEIKIVLIGDLVKDSDFKVFSNTIKDGGVVKAINAKGAGD